MIALISRDCPLADRLTGLVGNMVIMIAQGQQSYLFDDELA
jgi:hypothetical protein